MWYLLCVDVLVTEACSHRLTIAIYIIALTESAHSAKRRKHKENYFKCLFVLVCASRHRWWWSFFCCCLFCDLLFPVCLVGLVNYWRLCSEYICVIDGCGCTVLISGCIVNDDDDDDDDVDDDDIDDDVVNDDVVNDDVVNDVVNEDGGVIVGCGCIVNDDDDGVVGGGGYTISYYLCGGGVLLLLLLLSWRLYAGLHTLKVHKAGQQIIASKQQMVSFFWVLVKLLNSEPKTCYLLMPSSMPRYIHVWIGLYLYSPTQTKRNLEKFKHPHKAKLLLQLPPPDCQSTK